MNKHENHNLNLRIVDDFESLSDSYSHQQSENLDELIEEDPFFLNENNSSTVKSDSDRHSINILKTDYQLQNNCNDLGEIGKYHICKNKKCKINQFLLVEKRKKFQSLEASYFELLETRRNQYIELESILESKTMTYNKYKEATDIYKNQEIAHLSVDLLIDLESNLMNMLEEISKQKFKLVEESKNKILRKNQKNKCTICYENYSCILLKPCNHVPSCEICQLKIEVCPLCRSGITKKIKIKFKENVTQSLNQPISHKQQTDYQLKSSK